MIRKDLSKFFKFKANKGVFGIEIETETEAYGDYPSGFLVEAGHDGDGHQKWNITSEIMSDWEAKFDGSLRNFGIEYVLKKPLSYEESLQALDRFREGTAGIDFLKEPFSCSVHVHVNVANETWKTVGNFSALWVLFEDLLVNFSGPTRRCNLFALPTSVAEGGLTNLQRFFKAAERGQPFGLKINQGSGKYSALNICSFSKLGSFEIRTMRGTTDTDVLKEWVTILNLILEYSRRDHSPKEIVRRYRDVGLSILDEVFGHEIGQKLRGDLSEEEVEGSLDHNVFFAACLADTVANWDTISDVWSKADENANTPRKPFKVYYEELLNLPESDEPEVAAPEPVLETPSALEQLSVYLTTSGIASSNPDYWLSSEEPIEEDDEDGEVGIEITVGYEDDDEF